MASFLFFGILAVLLAISTWLFARAGFKAERFGDRSFFVWFMVLLFPLARLVIETLLYGWDKVVENAALSLTSWGLGIVWVTGCYLAGYALGRTRRERKPKIVPMK
jgi:hypothetical protein